MIEAAFLTLAGGIIGVITGWLIAYFVNNMGLMTTLVTADIVILAVSVSVGIGLFFGFYPAWNASRLNPFPDDWQLTYLGSAYFFAGRYEEALTYFKKLQERNPDNMWAYFMPAGIYGHLGCEEEARAAAKEILRINPKYSIEVSEKYLGCKNRDKWNLLINGLRKAGLK